MYRKVYKEIIEWIKNDDKHTLLVTGARQIGKTYIIREALKNENCDYVELNFIEDSSLIDILKDYKDVQELELRLSLASQHDLIPGETIFFFDEVQEVADIITMSKFLTEKTNYKFVMSGSLLGVEIKNLRSAPVGYMHIIDMYPMDLEEFYLAVGVNQKVLDKIKECYEKHYPVDDFLHEKLLSLFGHYLIVGGMPEAVETYIETNDLRKVAAVQTDLTNLYRKDFTKYNKKEKLILNEVYDAIPAELGEKNKRYFINHIDGKVSFDKMKNNFIWLKEAGVALPVYNATEPKCPLKISEKRNLFKLFLADVGMLTNMFSDDTKMKILNKDSSINNGAVYENFVAQELIAHGYDLYYYNNKKNGEVDFLIEHNGKVLPLEVKSGKDYKKHSALTNLLSVNEYEIDEAYILCNENISIIEEKYYMPIYMAMFFEENKVDMMVKVDLRGLNEKVDYIMKELQELPILLYKYSTTNNDLSYHRILLGNSEEKRGQSHDANLMDQAADYYINLRNAYYTENANIEDIEYNYKKLESICNRKGYDYDDFDEQAKFLYKISSEQLDEIEDEINMYKKIREEIGAKYV